MIPAALTMGLFTLALLGMVAAMPTRAASWWGFTAALLFFPRACAVNVPIIGAIDTRFMACLILAPALVFTWLSSSGHRRGLRATDWVVLALGAVMAISTLVAGSEYPVTGVLLPLMVYVLPYVIGRLSLESLNELNPFLKVICLGVVALVAATLVEVATGFNVFNLVGGRGRANLRMGLTRARGPTVQPLYFSMILFPLMGLALVAADRARKGLGPGWWKLMPWLVFLALLTTISRGPIVLSLGAVALFFILNARQWRTPLLILWVCGVIAGFGDVGVIKDFFYLFEKSADPTQANSDFQILVIDGKEYTYTSMDHRKLAFKVYERPLANTGLLGYGPELKGVNIEEGLQNKFWTLDNTYLSIALRYGRLGIGLFVGMFVLALWQLGRIIWDRTDPRGPYARGLFAVLAATLAALYGVGITPEFAPVMMFVLGLATNLTCIGTSTAPMSGGRFAGVPRPRELTASPAALAPVIRR